MGEVVRGNFTRQNNEVINEGGLDIAPEDVVSSFYRVQDGIRRGEITTVKGAVNVILEVICGGRESS
jgi:hypothetical protein